MYEFKPVASDGSFTIGYDADGLAGFIPGNMVDTFEKSSDFQRVREGHEFSDGNETYVAESESDSFGNQVLFWNEVQ